MKNRILAFFMAFVISISFPASFVVDADAVDSNVTVNSITASVQGGASSGTSNYQWKGTSLIIQVDASFTISSDIDADSLYFAVPANLLKDSDGNALDTVTIRNVNFSYTDESGKEHRLTEPNASGDGTKINNSTKSVVYNKTALETSTSTNWDVTFEAVYNLSSGHSVNDVSYIEPFTCETLVKDGTVYKSLKSSDTIQLINADRVPGTFEITSRSGIFVVSTNHYTYAIYPDQTQNADKISISVNCSYTDSKTFQAGEFQLKVPAHLLRTESGKALDTLTLDGSLASSFGGRGDVPGDYAVFTNTQEVSFKNNVFTFVYTPQETLPEDTAGGSFQCVLMSHDLELAETSTDTIDAGLDVSHLSDYVTVNSLTAELTSGGASAVRRHICVEGGGEAAAQIQSLCRPDKHSEDPGGETGIFRAESSFQIK